MEEARENPVRRRLRESLPVFGCTITSTSLELPRVRQGGLPLAVAGAGTLAVTLETVRHVVLATRGLPAVPFARASLTETWLAKRVLDAGVHGVIFPFVSTPELARTAADACRYPPIGHRGSGASLATTTWPEPDAYLDSADRNIVTVVIVEEVSALAHVDAIAATAGVDVVFVGTGDLSSLGLRGQQHHPRVEEAAATVLAARGGTARQQDVRLDRSK